MGIILTILEIIKTTSKPITEDEILAILKVHFPTKSPENMYNTILTQIGTTKFPNRLERENNIKLKITYHNNRKHYEITKSKTVQ